MKINKQQLKVVFEAFSIDEDILKWEELVHIENTVNEKLILKQYFRISTNRMSYILKLLSLPMCSNTVLEIQSRFSELYRTNGVPTPKRFVSKNGMYLMNFLMEEKEILISLEEDAGDQLLNFSSDTIVFMGNLLGKMHAVSIKKNCHFRPGNLYCEFRDGQTTYLPLWKRTGTDFYHLLLLILLCCRYYDLICFINNWLPTNILILISPSFHLSDCLQTRQ